MWINRPPAGFLVALRLPQQLPPAAIGGKKMMINEVKVNQSGRSGNKNRFAAAVSVISLLFARSGPFHVELRVASSFDLLFIALWI